MSVARTTALCLIALCVAGGASAQPLALPPVVPLPPVEPLPQVEPATPGGQASPSADGQPSPAPSGAVCAPEKLFRATIRNISPGLPAADRGAQPRHLWRLGSTFLRSEEQPDPVRGDQILMIVAEPDIWVINLAAGVGQHTVDPGPDLVVHAPILPIGPDMPPVLRTLEYGCEPAFVAQHAPRPQQLVKWGAIQASVHAAAFGEHTVVFLMDQRRNQPIMVSYLRQGRPVFVVRYDNYRPGLPPQVGLFQPPKNIRINAGSGEPPPIPLGRGGQTPFSN